MTDHYLAHDWVHPFWDNSLEPRLIIQPGDTVTFACRDSSDGQVTRNSTAASLDQINPDRVHPLTGPVYVDGAQPGDALEIKVLQLNHRGWGWSAHFSIGLLSDEFPEPYLHHWRLEDDVCHFTEGIRVPYEPFCGVMGVAPKQNGRFDTMPPRFNGGNIDIRALGPGTTVWLPVFVPGGLFSTGDGHAAQGDGEVCGTGIEMPMSVTLQFNVAKSVNLPELQFKTAGPVTRSDQKGYFVTTAHGPDLYVNSQNALRYMIDYLEREQGLTREQAYILSGAAVDLRISEVVDEPNWIVAAYLPLSLFD